MIPAARMIQKGNCVNFERFAIRSFSGCAYSFWFMFNPKSLGPTTLPMKAAFG